ncbi:MAG: hypothetical protein ACT4QB_17695 [Gammaproteobacteria bacterium]
MPNVDGDPTELAADALSLPYTTLSYANGPGYTGASDVQLAGLKTFPHIPAFFTNGALRPDMTSVDTRVPTFMPESTVPLSSETHSGEDVAIYGILFHDATHEVRFGTARRARAKKARKTA